MDFYWFNITSCSVSTLQSQLELNMKYMLSWEIPTNNYNTALDVFLEGGAPMPEGLVSLGRWHAPGSNKGWLLCETDSLVVLSQHVAEWAPLLNIEISPVIDDAEAGEALSRVRGN
jgi:hypothetical protein